VEAGLILFIRVVKLQEIEETMTSRKSKKKDDMVDRTARTLMNRAMPRTSRLLRMPAVRGPKDLTEQPAKGPVLPLLEEDETLAASRNQKIEETIRRLFQGKEKGFLTYEELNDALPDEVISPARLDSLLMTFDELGVQLLDEADIEKEVEEDFEETDKVGRSEDETRSRKILSSKKNLPKPKDARLTTPCGCI